MKVPLRIRIQRFLNKRQRSIKAHVLTRRTPVVTPLFYWGTSFVDRFLSGHKQTQAERLANMLWKQGYFERWSKPDAFRFHVVTDFPVAYSSDDHQFPRGTIFDNSTNPRFNSRLYQLLGFSENLRFLDLGRAGGGLVRSYLEDGYQACGLEGSDNSKRNRSSEWDTIPFHLFTADLTKDFAIVDAEQRLVEFDAVTAREVLEHIAEEDLAGLFSRIYRQLRPGGYFMAIHLPGPSITRLCDQKLGGGNNL